MLCHDQKPSGLEELLPYTVYPAPREIRSVFGVTWFLQFTAAFSSSEELEDSKCWL
jgi:hypothetical protein